MTERPATRDSGRPVVLAPNPPGFWTILLGVCLAGLGPLGGFLIGSALGQRTAVTGPDPIFLWLTIGIIVGGIGLAIATLGGFRLYRSLRARAEV